ncbi:MAG: acetyl-CoA carboxylase biotin carboxyl carrier protein [Acidobacteria bacterium]|nr:acetyl-CoA carboxylase biotin carboxyl carrier protein [Acidobacteriota bacterium]
MNLKEIKELIDLISEKNLAEFEMEKAGFKIKVVRNLSTAGSYGPVVTVGAVHDPMSGPAAPRQHVAGARETLPPAGTVAQSSSEEENLVHISSPIVGTFYRAPEPNAPAFVKEGDRVAKGQTLCIIEAMKLMNEIESETDGEIARILVQNGQAVEYGQDLFLLRPLS